MKTERERLTTDNPNTIDARLLNYCYAKDRRVMLRFAGGEEDVDLCEYVAVNVSNTTDCQITADEVMNGACLECYSGECPIGCLYFAAVQAAELRGRLKEYEDLEVGGKLIQLPCKVGDAVYQLDDSGKIYESKIEWFYYDKGYKRIVYDCDTGLSFDERAIEANNVFLSREEAERALKEREKGGV